MVCFETIGFQGQEGSVLSGSTAFRLSRLAPFRAPGGIYAARRPDLYAENDIFAKNVISENPTPEDLFLQKLVTIVEQNLSDEHFGLPDLCRKAALNRSQLFRKLKALTSKSTTHFIRSIRLAKGKVLLETTDMTVSEVAYAVGFGSATYFSKMFGEEYGMAPGAVRGK